MVTLTKMDRKRVFKAVEPAFYEGFYEYMWALPRWLRDIAFDLLNVVEQQPWRAWSEVLNEVLDY